jgi:FkbM family methyltransferase
MIAYFKKHIRTDPRAFWRRHKNYAIRTALSPLKRPFPYAYTHLVRKLKGHDRAIDELVKQHAAIIMSLKAGSSKPLFVDCGVNEGLVLSSFVSDLDGFQFSGFEIQQPLIARAQAINPSAQITHAAVAASNGETEVFLPKTYGMNFRGGSSIEKSKIASQDLFGKASVKTICFSEYLAEQRQVFDFVAVKMDIEGTEYAVIDDIYDRWRKNSVRLIDYLMIEFHPQVLSDPKTHQATIRKLQEMGVEFSTWV